MDGPDSPEVLQRVHAGLPIVDQVARALARSLRGTVEVEDLIGYGRIGLLAAARRFESNRGIPFEAFAAFRVRLALIDAVRSMALPRRTYERIRNAEAKTLFSEGLGDRTFVPKRRVSAPSLSHKLAETMAAMQSAGAVGLIAESAIQEDGDRVSVDSSDPEEKLLDAQFRALVLRLIDSLPDPEDKLIRRHYIEDERFDRIAADLQISKSWASECHSRGIAKLSKLLRRAD